MKRRLSRAAEQPWRFAGPALALALLAVGILFAVLSETAGGSPTVLRIGTNVWPGYEPLYLARDRRYFGNVPVHLVEYVSTTQVLEAYRNGAIDVAALSLDEALRLAADGEDPRIVVVTDVSNGADALVARPGIRGLRRLRGMRVGAETTALGGYVLARALQHAGLSTRDVTVVPLQANEHERAYREGLVDAVVTYDPVRARLVADGAHVLFSSANIPGDIADVVVVRGSYLASHPHQIAALRKGWFAAVDALEQRPGSGALSVAPREHLTASAYLRSLAGLDLEGEDGNIRLLGGPQPQLLVSLRELARFMRAHGLIGRSVAAPRMLAGTGGIG